MREQWAHGHEAQIERPEDIDRTWRAGFYARLNGHPGRSVWVHFAPPTPVIVGDRRLRVRDVSLRFRTGAPDAWVSAIHVFDGESRLVAHEALYASDTEWRMKRLPVPGHPEVKWGLGISVLLVFHDERRGAGDEAWCVDLAGAGASFE
jgi:hypothetical protein